MSTPSLTINDLLDIYMKQPVDEINVPELEVRFGTKRINKINKIHFDNVVKYLISKQFNVSSTEQYLRINSEFIDQKTGKNRISRIRTEIAGSSNISEFCKTNSIIDEANNIKRNISFLQKQQIRNTDGNIVRNVDIDDFNFRISLVNEKKMTERDGLIRQLINDWDDNKKLYRLITRNILTNQAFPYIQVHMSTIKHSKTNQKGNMIPTYNIRDSELFNNNELYEIEIEINKEYNLYNDTFQIMLSKIKNVIKYVLCGIQQSNFPIGMIETQQILDEYINIIHKENVPTRVFPKHFIGPSSISLELKNIQPINNDANIPNIRNGYTVTDKADGFRKLLFISENGKIYLIDTNMNIQFTGLITNSNDHKKSIIDGEHILHSKTGEFINNFAAFDIYFINSEDQRLKPFVNMENRQDFDESIFRLNQLQNFINTLEPEMITQKGTPLLITVKSFEIATPGNSIFKACKNILDRINTNLYEYETDGLIFTPCLMGVGMDNNSLLTVENDNNDDEQSQQDTNLLYSNASSLKNTKFTWNYSFKWKPSEFNTVDFLITTQKDQNGKDIIKNIFENGNNNTSNQQITQYKTLILRVGFDERKHGYLNPCSDVINDNLPSFYDDSNDNYRPIPFYPYNPSDNKASICNVILNEISGEKYMLTENGKENFEDEMIVEFKYVKDNEEGWRWVPIKVRYDKTSEYRNGLKNYGNAYHVAQSVWSSIHNPITSHMLETGKDISLIDDSDIYYNRVGKGNTRSLRDFHNLYVKKKLIYSVSKPGDILFDIAVGKGGDFPKWISSKLRFVLGMDVSRDNIENRIDGACARYLNYKKQYKRMPSALFLQGNAGSNIKNGNACATETGKKIINAINGVGAKDESELGKGIYKHYGIAENGFNIISTQFAIHYLFETKETLHNYLVNVSENCALGGYFIGTCYDGKKIFRELKSKKINTSISKTKEGVKIFEITKKYDMETLDDDDSCIGMAIDVYQESINKTIREYIVNFDYLVLLMDAYGFTLIDRTESKRIGMPNGSGLFSELFNQLQNDVEIDKSTKYKNKTISETGKAIDLINEPAERYISFLNRYFIFKKSRDVNVQEIKNSYLTNSEQLELQYENELTNKLREMVSQEKISPDTKIDVDVDVSTTETKPITRKIRKIKKKKLKLTTRKNNES